MISAEELRAVEECRKMDLGVARAGTNNELLCGLTWEQLGVQAEETLRLCSEVRRQSERIRALEGALANTRQGIRAACHRLLDENRSFGGRLERGQKDLRRLHEYAGEILSGEAPEERQKPEPGVYRAEGVSE